MEKFVYQCVNAACQCHEKDILIEASEYPGKYIQCDACGKNELMWHRMSCAPAYRMTDDQFTKRIKTKVSGDDNDVYRKSYHKEALKRTKKDWEALDTAFRRGR